MGYLPLRINLLQSRILPIVIRGDGSREGLGESWGDPKNDWWMSFKKRLSGLEGTALWFNYWDKAACVLADELIHWKNVLMPHAVEQSGYAQGVLLVDRTLISRLMMVTQAGKSIKLDDLYLVDNKPQEVNWQDVLPDLIFNFHVPNHQLLARLDDHDPKHQFRLNIIEKCFSLHVAISSNLPDQIGVRTVNINGDRDPDVIHQEILNKVKSFL